MKNSEKPMYPMPHQNQDGTIQHDVYFGLTKREYFAALAMQSSDLDAYAERFGNKWAKRVAKDAVEMADALLEELEKSTEL